MKRIAVFVTGVFVTLMVTGAVLEARAEANAPKIAVIDIQIILRESKAMKGVRDQIEEQRKKFQAEITDQEKKLRAGGQALEKQRAVLSPEAFVQKQRELQAKVVEVQGQVQSRRRRLDQAFAQAADTFQKTLIQLVEGVAKEKGYNLVFPKAQIVYAAPAFDITALTLKRLNKKLPSLKVNVSTK